MSYKILLSSLMSVVVATSMAHAQTGLGAPLATESESLLTEYAPRPRRPVFAQIAHTLFSPFRTQPVLLPPQATVESVPTRDDINRMVTDGSYSPAEITAAKIKWDEGQAKARQAAVRYLATVDCNYYPEAEAGLIAALRADRNETVRYEAAVALGTCRGATRRIIDALNLASLGQDTDGNPPETSDRVRQAAKSSLHRVLTTTMTLYPNDPAMMANVDWYQVYAQPPADYPAATYPLAMPMATPQERALAETISADLKNPPLITPTAPRSLIEWIQHHATPRDTAPAPAHPTRTSDPRLRGLRPLGSDLQLAIPRMAPSPPTPMYLPAYNDH